MQNLKDKSALITGASSGLGVDFANILAAAGCHLILVARRLERMQQQQEKIQKQHGVRVEVIPIDLAVPDSPQVLYEKVKEMGMAIDILINNAGVGIYGDFIDIPWDQEKNMLNLDIITLVHLTKLFLKGMVERNFGYVLNIASIGAYQPSPFYASYAAAKSFVLNFTEALNYELRHTKVMVSALSPGVTATEFLQTAGQQKQTLFQKLTMMQSYSVAKIGLETMLKGKPSKIAGFGNAISMFSFRFLPRRMTTFIAYNAVKGG